MVTLSLAMIVKNEEETMARVLACAKPLCDEMIVVDTGSTDKTVAIAEEMGATVHHFEWVHHFAKARNFAFEQCTSDWILWLDADDTISEADQQHILNLKHTVLNDDIDGVHLTYQYAFSKENECILSFNRERLIRREANLKWEYPVHECIAIAKDRSLNFPDICIQHYPLDEKIVAKSDRNITILQKAMDEGDDRPRNRFYYANELKAHQRYEEAIEAFHNYLDISNLDWEKYEAIMALVTCYNALEKTDEALDWCLKALLLDSTRAAAFNELGAFHYRNEAWEKAIPFFMAALSLTKPAVGFVHDSDYTWKPYDFLSICFERLGQYDKAMGMALRALPNNPERDRILENIKMIAEKL